MMNDDVDTMAMGSEAEISIHAGFPNPATDKRLQYLDLNQLLITHPSSTFLFRIRGEHGNTYGIFDGDVAIVDRAAAIGASHFVLWYDGSHFKLSRTANLAPDSTVWGVITAVIHKYERSSL